MVAKVASIAVAVALVVGLVGVGVAADDRAKAMKEAQATIAVFKKADPGLSRFFNAAVGYAVFPSITKAAIGIGERAAPGCSTRRARRPARPRSRR